MPQVLVWQCPATGQYFPDIKKYKKHLKKLARTRYEDRKKRKWRNALREARGKLRDTATNPQDIQQFFHDNWETIVKDYHASEANCMFKGEVFDPARVPKLEFIEFVEVMYCPAGDKPAGWTARVQWKYEERTRENKLYNPSFDILRDSRISIDCGSGGYLARCIVFMKESDWPGLKRAREHAEILKRLDLENSTNMPDFA